MNNEANKRIHALVKPKECFHEWDDITHPVCKTCEAMHEYVGDNTDWFDEYLPDNLRVAMVTAAEEKFGYLEVIKAISARQYTAVLTIPAPAIAEAIDRLLREEKGEQRP